MYDKHKHLCPLDSGLVERGVELYFSGFMKPIYGEDCDGVPVGNLGPIVSWWLSIYDDGPNILIRATTACAEYCLVEASTTYYPFITTLYEKKCLSKVSRLSLN